MSDHSTGMLTGMIAFGLSAIVGFGVGFYLGFWVI